MAEQIVVFKAENWGNDQTAPVIEALKNGKGHYSYFENQYGEQMIFTFDYDKEEAMLYHSDCDWEPILITDGLPVDTIINNEEFLWLAANWKAAVGEYPKGMVEQLAIRLLGVKSGDGIQRRNVLPKD